MEMILTKPIFKCRTDEKIFFQRLREVKNLLTITPKDEKLWLSCPDAHSHYVLKEIQTLSDIWNCEFIVTTSPKIHT